MTLLHLEAKLLKLERLLQCYKISLLIEATEIIKLCHRATYSQHVTMLHHSS